MGKTLEKRTVCDFACDFFLLYRALPIQMYFWEKFWDIWDSVVFSDGRVHGASWLACSRITRREIEPQPTDALRLHLVRLVLTGLANLFTLPGGGLG